MGSVGVASTALTLSSRGIGDAVDEEMSSGGPVMLVAAAQQCAVDAAGVTRRSGSQVNSLVNSPSVPTAAFGSGSGSRSGLGAEAAEEAEQRRGRVRAKRKARKQRVRRQRDEGKEELPVTDVAEEKGAGDAHPAPLGAGCQSRDVPAWLIASSGGEGLEYAKVMAEAQQSGGVVSDGTYQQLLALIESETDYAEFDRDSSTLYDHIGYVTLQVAAAPVVYYSSSDESDDAYNDDMADEW